MRISFVFLLALFIISITSLRERLRKANVPSSAKQKALVEKFQGLNKQIKDLQVKVDKAAKENDKTGYMMAVKNLSEFEKHLAERMKQINQDLAEIDKENKSKVDQEDQSDDQKVQDLADHASKIAQDLDKEVEQDQKAEEEAKKTAEKQLALEKTLKAADQQSISLAQLTDGERARTILGACVKAAANATPPQFCWKKGADFGVIPTGCPHGYRRILALCFQRCGSGYYHHLGMCHQYCPSGYSNMGFHCHRWWWPHSRGKHMYWPHSMTNFDGRIPCPAGRYKSGALCYRDCGKIGMVNCGIGACARDSGACASNIVNMVVSVIEGIIQAVVLVVSLGSSSGLTNGFKLLSTAAKKVGKTSLKAMMKGVKSWWRRVSKEQVKNIMKKAVKAKLKGQIDNAATNSMINLYCSNVASAFKNQIEGNDSSFDFSKIDVTGISGAVKSCTSGNDVNCARSIVTVVSKIDPTGITTIAAAFMHSTCIGV